METSSAQLFYKKEAIHCFAWLSCLPFCQLCFNSYIFCCWCDYTEQSISQTWAHMEDNQRRELLLQAFRQRCILSRKVLSDDVQGISVHCQSLEQMARYSKNIYFCILNWGKKRESKLFFHKSCHGLFLCVCVYCRKAEIEVLFDKPSSSRDDDSLNTKVATEAQVLVKHTCILFS